MFGRDLDTLGHETHDGCERTGVDGDLGGALGMTAVAEDEVAPVHVHVERVADEEGVGDDGVVGDHPGEEADEVGRTIGGHLETEAELAHALEDAEPAGNVLEELVTGMIGRRESGGFNGVLDAIDSLDADHEEEVDGPAGLGQEDDGLSRDGRQEPAGELFTLERGVGDRRTFGVSDPDAEGDSFGGPGTDDDWVRTGVGAAFDGVLDDDVTHLEEEGRVDVTGADKIEEELLVEGADDLLVLVEVLAVDQAGTDAGGAAS